MKNPKNNAGCSSPSTEELHDLTVSLVNTLSLDSLVDEYFIPQNALILTLRQCD